MIKLGIYFLIVKGFVNVVEIVVYIGVNIF